MKKVAQCCWIFIILCSAQSANADGTVALPECTRNGNGSGLEWRTTKQMFQLTLNASNVSRKIIYNHYITNKIFKFSKKCVFNIKAN